MPMINEIEFLLKEAQQAHQQGKLEDAMKGYEQLLKKLPEHSELLIQIHRNMAHAYRKMHRFEEAIHYYSLALQSEPSHAETLHNLANLYAIQGNYQAALKTYSAALQVAPDFTIAHYNLGLLFLKHQELAAASKQFKNVITLNPDYTEAHFYLGVLALESGQLEEAEQAFQTVLTLAAEHVEALTNLGVIALKQDKAQLAIDYFTKAIALEDGHVEARNNLAATFMHHDRFENALMHYDVLLKQDPANVEYLYNMGVAQMALGHLKEATQFFTKILSTTEFFAALNNLAAIEMRLGHREEAIAYLNRALIANPQDEASQLMLHALTGDKKQPQASLEYVRNLFNNYALYYDQHMRDALKYTLPQHIIRILHKLGRHQVNRTLDMGCGTGMSGSVLREISHHLSGIDLSKKMLAEARSKGIYDQLFEMDLVDFLQQHDQNYDLIVAADVLPYLGDLEALFSTIHSKLTENGLFVFSCEISHQALWELQASVRFSHHPDYIHTLCTRFELQLIYQEQVTARQQASENLDVIVYVAQKSSTIKA